MAAKSHLASGQLNLAALREYVRSDLLECISSVPGGRKALVIDKDLIGILGLIAEFSALKERGVEKMYPLEGGALPPDTPECVIYLVRPKVHLCKLIGENVHMGAGSSRDHIDYRVFFVPRRTITAEKALEEEGVRADISHIGEFQLNLVPLESDVMSMELPESFRDCILHGDQTSLFYVAHALMQVQVLYGIIPRIVGKGDMAARVAQMMIHMRKEQGTVSLASPQIESVIILDRTVDLVTPLCSQLTYEGLIDELYGIRNNLLELPINIAPLGPNGRPAKVELNSADKLYSEIRDLNFSKVGPLLSHRARNLSKEYDERHQAKTVKEIKQFTSKLKRMQEEQQSLKLHTDLAGDIMTIAKNPDFLSCLDTEQTFICAEHADKSHEYVEDAICCKGPLPKVLRLICLQSLTNNGLKPKLFDFYRHEILQTYGHEHLLTLDNLERAGLLKQQDSKNIYPQLRKSFRLVVDEDPELPSPMDVSYVYSGYAPLSVRTIEALTTPGGIRTMEEALRALPGDLIERQQELPQGMRNAGQASAEGQPKQPVVLVVFLGGCTYAEVAALRFLSQKEGRDYVIATTSMINGQSMLKSMAVPLALNVRGGGPDGE